MTDLPLHVPLLRAAFGVCGRDDARPRHGAPLMTTGDRLGDVVGDAIGDAAVGATLGAAVVLGRAT